MYEIRDVVKIFHAEIDHSTKYIMYYFIRYRYKFMNCIIIILKYLYAPPQYATTSFALKNNIIQNNCYMFGAD